MRIGFARKQCHMKIVYVGPPSSGKHTNLEWIAKNAKEELHLVNLDNNQLFSLRFKPDNFGKILGLDVFFTLNSLAEQTDESSEKFILQGADGVVFVADSQSSKLEANIEYYGLLAKNSKAIDIENPIPVCVQYNKRDLVDILSLKELNEKVNKNGHPFQEVRALEGVGVYEAFLSVANGIKEKMIMNEKSKKNTPRSNPLFDKQNSSGKEWKGLPGTGALHPNPFHPLSKFSPANPDPNNPHTRKKNEE